MNILDVRLEIVENDGAAAALVTYVLAFDSNDLGQSLDFVETVELIGVDQIQGEDGQNDAIPGSRSEADVTLSFTESERRRLIALPAKALDEDRDSSGPANTAAVPKPDEILARVTLTPRHRGQVSRESAILVLHQSLRGNQPFPVA